VDRTEESKAHDELQVVNVLAGDPAGGLLIIAQALNRFACYGPSMGPKERVALFDLEKEVRQTASIFREDKLASAPIQVMCDNCDAIFPWDGEGTTAVCPHCKFVNEK
jgi:hypothetical protein